MNKFRGWICSARHSIFPFDFLVEKWIGPEEWISLRMNIISRMNKARFRWIGSARHTGPWSFEHGLLATKNHIILSQKWTYSSGWIGSAGRMNKFRGWICSARHSMFTIWLFGRQMNRASRMNKFRGWICSAGWIRPGLRWIGSARQMNMASRMNKFRGWISLEDE